MFGDNDAHLTISSTRNNHHLLYGVFNRTMITLFLASSWRFHPPGIFSFPPWRVQLGQGHIGHCWLPSNFSISKESHLAFAWTLPFSPSSLSFPYHPLSLVLELETHPYFLSLAQKPWQFSFLLRRAVRFWPPFHPSSLVYFHFVQMVSNHIWRPL